jgi:deoxyribonuclease-4
MAILGAHMSIAGGYYRAVEIAKACGCDCVQLFTKNNNQWAGKPISDADADRFKSALNDLQIAHPISHDSYLINLAAPDETLWRKSIDAFVIELERADQLGIPYVVTHPGSYTTTSEEEGLARIVTALDEVHARLPHVRAQCLLETTAGQGTNLGWRFEHLGAILNGVRDSHRLGVCVDTCHVFAAGYPLAPAKDFKATFRELDQRIGGLERVRAFHLNDSKREQGSRVDRHEHIGQGHLGLEPFALLLADPRFRQVPMYLETPKGQRDGEELDVINLRTLRNLIAQ